MLSPKTSCPKAVRNIVMYMGAVSLWASLGREGCLGIGLWCIRGGGWVGVF